MAFQSQKQIILLLLQNGRISAIKYLNTIPFIYGLESSPIMDEIVMEACSPAESADNLLSDRSDGYSPCGDDFAH